MFSATKTALCSAAEAETGTFIKENTGIDFSLICYSETEATTFDL